MAKPDVPAARGLPTRFPAVPSRMPAAAVAARADRKPVVRLAPAAAVAAAATTAPARMQRPTPAVAVAVAPQSRRPAGSLGNGATAAPVS